MIRGIAALLATLLIVPSAEAVEWTLHGAVRNEAAWFVSGERRLDKLQNRLDLKPEALLAGGWEFRGRLLGWYDAAMDIEATNAADLNPGIKKHYRTLLRSQEAYLLYTGTEFDLRLGQQQIVWGKTDGLRMLDIVNPLDMREFMLDDFLDSRLGLWAARLNYYADLGGNMHEFELILIPDARPAELAPAGARWALAMPILPAGVVPLFRSGHEPGWAPGDLEAGAAWRANLDGWDLSLNWFYGWKDTPLIEKSLAGAVMSLTPVYRRMHTLGGSFSNAFGPLVLRGELAANLGEGVNRTGVTPASSVGRKTTLNAAIGLDYTKNNWRISPQLFIRHLPGWDATVAEDRSSGFASLMLSTDYMNEKLKPEIIALLDWADGGWLVRPKLSYEFSDRIIGRLGADLFYGSKGFFGQFDRNDRLYSEIEYAF